MLLTPVCRQPTVLTLHCLYVFGLLQPLPLALSEPPVVIGFQRAALVLSAQLLARCHEGRDIKAETVKCALLAVRLHGTVTLECFSEGLAVIKYDHPGHKLLIQLPSADSCPQFQSG